MTSTQPATNSPRLPIDITALIATKEQGHPRDLVSHSTALQRIQLPNLPLRPARPRVIKHRLRHAGLDQTGTDGIDPDTSASELIRARLGDGHHGRFRGGVIG